LRKKAEATKQSSFLFCRKVGLLRGACHRARVRATRWLAMTLIERGVAGGDAADPVGASRAIVAFPIVRKTLYGAPRFHLALTGLHIDIKGLAVSRGLWRAA
jgi:hypothetical protein